MLKRIDEFWAKVERVGIIAGFLLMSLLVFLDVVHRTAADRSWQTPKNVAVLALIAWGLFHAAIRTSSRGQIAHMKAAGFSLAGTAVSGLVIWIFVKLVPSGIIWAQTFALVLTIWVGFLGASLATKEMRHLKVDAAEKLFRGETKRWVGVISEIIAALFSGALAILSTMYCLFVYRDWDVFESIAIPKFIAFGILPVTFATMSLRFAALAIQTFRKPAETPGPGAA